VRKTLFWTAIYSTVAFAVLTFYNIFFLHNLEVDDNATRFFAITANQQISHSIALVILILLVVELYYQKKAIGGPQIHLGKAYTSKEEVKSIHPDIPESYFEDPKEKSVADRINGDSLSSKEGHNQ
jgi:hypothetical protein